MKTALITGASGMVGSLVLQECLTCDDISKVIILVRKNLDVSHPKLTKILHQDYEDYSSIAHELANVDVAFFCIGVYTGQVSDHEFKKITVDFPVALAKSLTAHNPNATFCLLSGAGADRTEKKVGCHLRNTKVWLKTK